MPLYSPFTIGKANVLREGTDAVIFACGILVDAALHAAAESGRILAGYVFAAALMFLISIIIVLVCTNII